MMTLLIVLATAAEAYLLGSIDTGILVSKYLYHDDVRNYGCLLYTSPSPRDRG